MDEYFNLRRITYGEERATFIPVCETCKQFVKADKTVFFNGLGELKDAPNATCKKHGRTKMIFEGYI